MIPKLRRKIMAVLMIVMSIFLAITISFAFLSLRRSLDNQIQRAMRAPLQREPREPQIRTPVALVTISQSGEITIESNQIYSVTDERIRSYVTELMDDDRGQGEIGSEKLQYLRRETRDGPIVYVFADTQFERNFARDQVRNLLFISAIAFVGFLFTSWLLAQWLVKPVARAWDKQRQFIADASHELKTPLTVILSNTEMLISSNVIPDARNRQRLDNISAESQRMRSLVESLLTLARSDNAPRAPQKTLINLSYQVSSAVLTLEPAVYDAGHALVSDIAPDLSMYAISQEITQLIEILIDNACKYSLPGSDIELTLRAEKKEAVMSVKSQGNPLSKSECIEIFERFYRTDTSREITQGYGLGLSIAAEIVKHCGGSISASSDGVTSNTFFVRLPLAQGSEPGRQETQSA